MKVGGYHTETDFTRIGGVILVATSLVVAIRTARMSSVWPEQNGGAGDSHPALDKEVEFASRMVDKVFRMLIKKHPAMWPTKSVPWYVATDDESPK